MDINTLTEQDSKYNDLELMSVSEIVKAINSEDKIVPLAVEAALSQIEVLVNRVVSKLSKNGRLFYIGAGTSGRLGVLDASECINTFGISQGMIVGIIAGGDSAIRTTIKGAEDDATQGFKDLQSFSLNLNDIVIGLSASGLAPYVVNALKSCRENGIETGCIVCSVNTNVSKYADYPVEVIVGPEFITGSTRMKCGTAQKLVLNMVSTTAMIKLGRVQGNKMTHMRLTNNKLVERGIRIVMEKTNLSYEESKKMLETHNNNLLETLESFRNN